MSGLFDLINSDDLCAKLDHDYRRVKSNSSDVFAAFDFVITAWHLFEWKYPGSSGKSEREAICEQYPILGVCKHLCIFGKHYAPTNPKLNSVQSSFRKFPWKRGVWAEGIWAKGVWEDELSINLTGKAKIEFGDVISMEKKVSDIHGSVM